MENLYAYSYLCIFGFYSMKEYDLQLDEMFSKESDNEILLELEECSNDYKNTFARLQKYFEYEVDFLIVINLEKHFLKD